MRYVNRRGRSKPSGESGSFWLTFSDLMSALLLVFVLVMFYSVYQYLDMLEVKTAELVRQSGLLDQKETELQRSQAQLDQSQQALKTQQTKLDESEQAMIAQQAKLLLFQQELDDSEALLASQRAELDRTRALLDEQQQTVTAQQAHIDAQQSRLADAESRLSTQQSQLADAESRLSTQQSQLTDAEARLAAQQAEMAAQQARLDALVGVRAQIIASLGEALTDANVRATVDAQTGSITLDASVLFDVGKSELKESGKRMLDRFLPVYLSVLMEGENSENVSEIIIEGHTDTDGTYLSNLRLSQERALSVMAYILSDDYGMITGGMKRRLRQIATANGRSFSNPVTTASGAVDKDASRRVEFKFRLQDEQMIEDMKTILDRMD